MTDMRIYRIQDATGRGPWRPGFSRSWVSGDSDRPLPPPVQDEFANFFELVSEAHGNGEHLGCGVRGAGGLIKWFLPDEVNRLKQSGFRLVRCHAVKVLAESENQVLFASRKPLHLLPLVNWPSLSIERVAA